MELTQGKTIYIFSTYFRNPIDFACYPLFYNLSLEFRLLTLKLGKEFHSISQLSNGKIYDILQKNVQFLILLMLKRIIPLKYEAGN